MKDKNPIVICEVCGKEFESFVGQWWIDMYKAGKLLPTAKILCSDCIPKSIQISTRGEILR